MKFGKIQWPSLLESRGSPHKSESSSIGMLPPPTPSTPLGDTPPTRGPGPDRNLRTRRGWGAIPARRTVDGLGTSLLSSTLSQACIFRTVSSGGPTPNISMCPRTCLLHRACRAHRPHSGLSSCSRLYPSCHRPGLKDGVSSAGLGPTTTVLAPVIKFGLPCAWARVLCLPPVSLPVQQQVAPLGRQRQSPRHLPSDQQNWKTRPCGVLPSPLDPFGTRPRGRL